MVNTLNTLNLFDQIQQNITSIHHITCIYSILLIKKVRVVCHPCSAGDWFCPCQRYGFWHVTPLGRSPPNHHPPHLQFHNLHRSLAPHPATIHHISVFICPLFLSPPWFSRPPMDLPPRLTARPPAWCVLGAFVFRRSSKTWFNNVSRV
jgi:hypothetical protein